MFFIQIHVYILVDAMIALFDAMIALFDAMNALFDAMIALFDAMIALFDAMKTTLVMFFIHIHVYILVDEKCTGVMCAIIM